MYKEWDQRFDEVCGAAIRDNTCEPEADSGIGDLLHGTRPEPNRAARSVSGQVYLWPIFDIGGTTTREPGDR